MSCEYLERDLDAFLDRELDAESMRAVRDHLNGCAGCRQWVSERHALSRLVRSAPYYRAPAPLRARVSAHASRRSMTTSRVLTWAAAAVLVLAAAAGIAVYRTAATRPNELVEQVVDSHVRSLMADHLFDVQSTDQHTVKPWFLGKLDFSPPVVDLANLGFPLIGGRLDYLAGRPVAALVYQRRAHTINVFVAPEARESAVGPAVRTVRGFHVYHWTHNGMSFWAASDLNDAELTQFVQAMKGR